MAKLYILDVHNAAAACLHDAALLESVILDALTAAGATCLRSTFHAFQPHGITGLILLAESHCAVHTWPESDFLTLDIFSCTDTFSIATFIGSIETLFPSATLKLIEIDRSMGA